MAAMKLQIDLTSKQAESLLEEEIASLPDNEKWKIRGHGTRSRECIRRAISRRLPS